MPTGVVELGGITSAVYVEPRLRVLLRSVVAGSAVVVVVVVVVVVEEVSSANERVANRDSSVASTWSNAFSYSANSRMNWRM